MTPGPPPRSDDTLLTEGYAQALRVLRRCHTEHGFWASPTEHDNYRRIWARDGCIAGLAALLSGDADLVEGCRRTLETLAASQGPHGEIPSNVDPRTDRVSYGGTVGRVDSDLWFVLACSEYWRRTGDEAFLLRMMTPLENVRRLLGAWEFNDRGLLYVPPAGDWADEYVQSGYVLYDQVLYLAAQRQFCAIHRHLHGSRDHRLEERVNRLEQLITANFWFRPGEGVPRHVYHEILYEKGRKAAPHRAGHYWMPFFTPFGYGYRFDALANTLVSLLGVADEEHEAAVDEFIDHELHAEACPLLPAFWPVITPKDEKWDELQTIFNYEFKNRPYEYHNGGRWPMVTGFYVASLARRGLHDRARRYLASLHRANRLAMDGQEWSFPEYLHGRSYAPEGTHPMGWSAAAAIIGDRYLAGERLFGADGAGA